LFNEVSGLLKPVIVRPRYKRRRATHPEARACRKSNGYKQDANIAPTHACDREDALPATSQAKRMMGA
jgi:hypothetical protein